ncbi:hypothetical protein J7M23_08150 [Candidatus Sumerlaeota bacterium]|nr:hypothetical protein [Candidatus Sumerlaeota bacterium]
MRYQRINVSIWQNPRFKGLSPLGQRLYLYLLSCPHGNLLGLFYLPPGYMCTDLSISPEELEKSLKELEEKTFIKYDPENEIIWVIDFLEHNSFDNPNQVKSAEKLIAELPPTSLLRDFYERIDTVSIPDKTKSIVKTALENRSQTVPKPFPNRSRTVAKPLRNRCETVAKPLRNRSQTVPDTDTDTDTDTVAEYNNIYNNIQSVSEVANATLSVSETETDCVFNNKKSSHSQSALDKNQNSNEDIEENKEPSAHIIPPENTPEEEKSQSQDKDPPSRNKIPPIELRRRIFDKWREMSRLSDGTVLFPCPRPATFSKVDRHIISALKDVQDEPAHPDWEKATDDICSAIENYARVLASPDYFFSYRWTIDQFLRQKNALTRFLSENNPLETYRSNPRSRDRPSKLSSSRNVLLSPQKTHQWGAQENISEFQRELQEKGVIGVPHSGEGGNKNG